MIEIKTDLDLARDSSPSSCAIKLVVESSIVAARANNGAGRDVVIARRFLCFRSVLPSSILTRSDCVAALSLGDDMSLGSSTAKFGCPFATSDDILAQLVDIHTEI